MAGSAQGPILVTGATGQVGSELVRTLAVQFPRTPIAAPTHAELDLSEPACIRKYVRALRPRWIVNPAAYTAVDRAETDHAAAFTINGDAPGVLGEEAARIGAAVLHFSTDYVFDGAGSRPYREDDVPGPLGVYGASKLAGEQALAASGAAHLILRTSWVYGATGKNFLLTVLRLAREREQMSIVDDQHGAPTWARDLARLSTHIIVQTHDAGAVRAFEGVYHAASEGETTWFGFAQQALSFRSPAEPATRFAELLPIATSAYPTAAARPCNSRLDCSKLDDTFGYRMPNWRQALAEVLKEIPG